MEVAVLISRTVRVGVLAVLAIGVLAVLAIGVLAIGVLAVGVLPLTGVALPVPLLRLALLPVDLEECGDLFRGARDWYGSDEFRVVQLAWPDRSGWMPWEAGFDHRLLLAQPVVGALEGLES